MKSLYAMGPLALLLFAIGACDNGDSSDQELRRNHGGGADGDGVSGAVDPEQTASGEFNTFNHVRESIGGENGITDVPTRVLEERTIGTPEEVARLHGAQKISYVALGKMLTDFGVNVKAATTGGKTTTAALTAAQLYTAGKSALGAPVYSSRTPEMSIPSTSALAKEYDIFVASAADIVANIGKSTRCPGVVLLENNQLTEDGVSCLIGKPATAAHMALANKMISDSADPTKGAQIAVATLLAAAHISE
jgi:hypothetical protein